MTDWENKTNLTQPNRKTRQPWGQTDKPDTETQPGKTEREAGLQRN